jgi:hypothetical protein
MSVLTTGLWKAPQNTKVAALSHVASFRPTFTSAAAAGSVTVAFPANYNNPAQLTAPTASAYDANSEPQNGQRLMVTGVLLRDVNAAAVTGTTVASTVAVQHSNDAGTTWVTDVTANLPLAAALATNPGQFVLLMGTGANTLANPNALFRLNITTGTGGSAVANCAFTADVLGVWVQGI